MDPLNPASAHDGSTLFEIKLPRGKNFVGSQMYTCMDALKNLGAEATLVAIHLRRNSHRLKIAVKDAIRLRFDFCL